MIHLQFTESETVELKEQVTEDIKKEIIAFANCEGGTLYIGVNDQGTVTGISDPDHTMLQITNMVRDNIKPDITMFLHYDVIEADGKQVIAIHIQRGSNRPYYLSKKGLRPEGVYVRQGTSAVPSTDTAIRHMIKDTDGDSFEALRSLNQTLTFQATDNEFAKRGIAFAELQKKTLGLINSDGIYTNLALLLSEQCTHTIKIAVFEGTDSNVFKDRREFTGSLLQQLNEAYEYIDFRNQTQATFEGLYRIDTRDYPEVAIREALLNALIHRDYAFSASTNIRIYHDRIEFISIGGLLAGVTLEDVTLGLSVCRNPRLANLFYRLELIEAYGTGLQKIMKAYAQSRHTPEIQTTNNAFKIILPNQNAGTAVSPIASTASTSNTQYPEERAVLQLLQENGTMSRSSIASILGLSQSTSGRLIRHLLSKGLITQVGRGRITKYRLSQ